jgi:two-component system sensor histidine kinase KdpD
MSKEAIDLCSALAAPSPSIRRGPRAWVKRLVAFMQQSRGYGIALAATAALTALAYPLYPQFNVTNIAMLYLLGTTFVALAFGRGPALLMSVVNLLALDYFFIPPLFSLDIQDLDYSFTLVVTLAVATVITHLVVSIQRHREFAEARAGRLGVLNALCRELNGATDGTDMASAAVRHLRDLFHTEVDVVLTDAADPPCDPVLPAVLASGRRLIADAVYEPLHGSARIEGVLIVQPRTAVPVWSAEELHLLEAFAGQLALALERAHTAATAQAARVASERTMLCNTLLASISHDLRTPLAAIAGAGSLIALPSYDLDRDRRATLGQLIERKAQDMTSLVANILKFAEIELGREALKPDWHAVHELVDHSLRVNAAALCRHRISVKFPADLPLIPAEATLIVQILNNLLQNAAKYTPAGTEVTISARLEEDTMVIGVDDDGPGLPPQDVERLFEKFQRGRNESSILGVGLGLAICRSAARLHGGDLTAGNNARGGASFELRLPVRMKDPPGGRPLPAVATVSA